MKTFNWLRNVLKVSLILQKPIIPSSFVEQVESLLPGYEKVFPQDGVASGVNFDQYSDNSATDEMVVEIAKIKRKLEIERAVQNAKVDYLKELDGQWRTLTSLIDIHNNDKTRMDVLIEARHIAHRIRGTAGSVGLPHVSAIATSLEEFLLGLDGQEDTQQEVIWSEVIRVLASGHQAVFDAQSTVADTASEISDKPNVLVISAYDDVIEASLGNSIKKVANVEVTNNPAGVASIFAKHRVDAVLLEMTSDRRMSIQRATEVRQLPGASALPLGFLSTLEAPPSAVEQLYLGCSICLEHPIEEESLEEAILQLLSVANPDQPRVLAIDDDDVLCRFVASVLHSERMETMTSTNPIEGLEMIDQFRPDLILLDVMMPALTGFEVCRRIRENRYWQDIPVVFLTSKTSAEARAAAFAVGANDFVTKPVIATELIHRIKTLLNESALKRQVRTRDPETGVLNGDSVMELANLLLEKHRQYMAPMAVALISIDDYDQLTLVQGHFSAKQTSKCLGDLLQLRFRAEDLRGRWSDRGYVLIVEQCDRDLVAQALRLLQEDFENIQFGGGAFKFTSSFSAGVSDSYDDDASLEGLIKAAHTRMKEAMNDRKGVVAGGG